MNLFDPRALGARPAGLRRERVLGSPRFKDGRFQNTAPLVSTLAPGQSLAKRFGIVSELVRGGPGRFPDVELPVESPLAAWVRPAETGLRATWLGHSAVLLEIDGVRVLTDPVFGERVSPVSWAGPRRFHRPPVKIFELPDLDAVLVSHDHFDHLDYPTILELARRDARSLVARSRREGRETRAARRAKRFSAARPDVERSRSCVVLTSRRCVGACSRSLSSP